MEFVPTSEGYYDFKKDRYVYHYTDHLGNVRVSYAKNPAGNIEIVEENNYYPFGLKHKGYNQLVGNSNYQYQYNGKELQTETGMYDYGARFYMPELGRWGVVDPLAEKTLDPYGYVYNNPIKLIDPTGMEAEICIPCATALGGAIAGGLIGGGIEAGIQLYNNGKITNWKAVGGSALQGVITGGTAGLTGGTSLAVTAGVSAGANVVGGTANRAIQGKKTTVKDIAVDATVGALGGAISKGMGVVLASNNQINIATNKLTNMAKSVLKEMGAGKGPIYGTKAHSAFVKMADGLKIGNNTVRTEISYLNGQIVKHGTKGSARIDVGLYDSQGKLLHVFDLKTGGAKLTEKQIQHIHNQTRTQVKVTEIRGD